jgi:hypothetical protein
MQCTTEAPALNSMEGNMAEFLVTCSLAIYLIALLYGAYRVITSRESGRSVIRERYRKFRLIPRRAQQFQSTPDLPYYV